MIADILKTNFLAAVVVILTIVLARLMKNRYSVRWKYIVWLAIAVFMFIPARVYSPGPAVNLYIPETIYIDKPSPASASAYINEHENIPEHSMTDNTDYADARTGTGEIYDRAAEGNAPLPASSVILFPVETALNLFTYVWICGAGIACVIYAAKYSSLSRKLRLYRGKSIPPYYEERYRQICEKMELAKSPELYIYEKTGSPLLAGIAKPCLYLPQENYSADELELIFLHELTHYKNRDLLYKRILLIVRIVYWFNPAFALMQREADRDLESICDSKVVSMIGDKRRTTTYGRLLLKTAAEAGVYSEVAAGLNDGVAKFKERMIYMMKADKLKKGVPTAILIIALFAAFGSLIGCSVGSGTASLSGSETVPEANTSSGSSASSSSVSSSTFDDANTSSASASSEFAETSSSSSPVAPAEVSASSATSDESDGVVADPGTSSTSASSSSAAADEPSGFEYTPVKAQYRLYEETYGDSRGYSDAGNPPEDVYEIQISNVTAETFDFSIIHRSWTTNEVLDTVIENATAIFVGDGTEARYLNDEFDLKFLFPDNHSALPDVADIEVHGFAPMEGKLYLFNGIPGHEFS